jgi:hypothetical protein
MDSNINIRIDEKVKKKYFKLAKKKQSRVSTLLQNYIHRTIKRSEK